MNITISKAHHAVLYERYDLQSGRMVKVGDRQGMYGPEDKATGAEYRCLGGDSKRGKVSYSSDCVIGHFYSPNVFIWGDDNGVALSHEQIVSFCKQIRWDSYLRWCILPNGYRHGRMTWDNAVYYSPVERQPDLDTLVRTMKQQIPSAEVCRYENRIDVYWYQEVVDKGEQAQ